MKKMKGHDDYDMMAMPMPEKPTLAERVAQAMEWQLAERLAKQLLDVAVEQQAGPVAEELGLRREIGGVRVAFPDGAGTTHALAKVPRGRRI